MRPRDDPIKCNLRSPFAVAFNLAAPEEPESAAFRERKRLLPHSESTAHPLPKCNKLGSG